MLSRNASKPVSHPVASVLEQQLRKDTSGLAVGLFQGYDFYHVSLVNDTEKIVSLYRSCLMLDDIREQRYFWLRLWFMEDATHFDCLLHAFLLIHGENHSHCCHM
jgi:hypothetical protein